MKITKEADRHPGGPTGAVRWVPARLDRVTPEITARIRAEIPGYAPWRPTSMARTSTARSATPWADWSSGSGPTASAIDHAREVGAPARRRRDVAS